MINDNQMCGSAVVDNAHRDPVDVDGDDRESVPDTGSGVSTIINDTEAADAAAPLFVVAAATLDAACGWCGTAAETFTGHLVSTEAAGNRAADSLTLHLHLAVLVGPGAPTGGHHRKRRRSGHLQRRRFQVFFCGVTCAGHFEKRVVANGGCAVQLAGGDTVRAVFESAGLVMQSATSGIGRRVPRFDMQPDHGPSERLGHAAACAASCAADATKIRAALLDVPRIVMTSDAAADLAANRRRVADLALRVAESATALAVFAQEQCAG
jgi:hypothetical protein